MGKIIDLTIPPDQFALSETFGAMPEARFEALPVAVHESSSGIPLLSVSSSNLQQLDDAIRADETTEKVTLVSTDENRSLYRISWHAQVQSVIDELLNEYGLLLNAHGVSDHWQLRLLFPKQAPVSTICENWREHGIEPSIQRVHCISRLLGSEESELSKCQLESLTKAYELDYYSIPRGVTLSGLAGELGVSHQALSERLRRGHQNLIRTTLHDSPAVIRDKFVLSNSGSSQQGERAQKLLEYHSEL